MSLEQFGSSGSTPEQAITYPVRAAARILNPSGVRDNFRREGVVGGVMDTGTQLAGRVGREAITATTGVVGYGVGRVRDAVMSTLGFAGRAGLSIVRNAEIVPFMQSPQQRMELQRRYPYADPDELAIRSAMDRITGAGQRTGQNPAGPNTQPTV